MGSNRTNHWIHVEDISRKVDAGVQTPVRHDLFLHCDSLSRMKLVPFLEAKKDSQIFQAFYLCVSLANSGIMSTIVLRLVNNTRDAPPQTYRAS